MHILHCIGYDPAQYLDIFPVSNDAHRTPLHQDVTLCQELQGLQCCTIWTYESLPPLYESFSIPYVRPDLDDLAENTVFENPECLLVRYAPG